ncbi:MAG TPA: hypothetical protein VLF67_04245 [Candidatus Saccharimonas sp.]|nr:hypothetical protein [Candidatus Saccharimonas sp.]
MSIKQRVQRLAMSGFVLFGLVGASIAMPATANASATWCTYTKTIGTAPLGQYCFSVNGSGLYVNNTIGSWNGPWVDYPREKVTFYDTYGNAYATYYTYSGTGRTYGYRAWYSGIHGTARTGHVCGEFMSYGTTIGTVCLNIHS